MSRTVRAESSLLEACSTGDPVARRRIERHDNPVVDLRGHVLVPDDAVDVEVLEGDRNTLCVTDPELLSKPIEEDTERENRANCIAIGC